MARVERPLDTTIVTALSPLHQRCDDFMGPFIGERQRQRYLGNHILVPAADWLQYTLPASRGTSAARGSGIDTLPWCAGVLDCFDWVKGEVEEAKPSASLWLPHHFLDALAEEKLPKALRTTCIHTCV
jgi:hypothetical protein